MSELLKWLVPIALGFWLVVGFEFRVKFGDFHVVVEWDLFNWRWWLRRDPTILLAWRFDAGPLSVGWGRYR